MKLIKYFKIWWRLTNLTTQIALQSRFGAIIFFIGKFLRFGVFLFFIFLIQSKTQAIAGYDLWQIIFFFATFNIIDVLAQLFLREVYRFRSHVVKGTFDFILTKPISPLFRSLFGGTDVLDLPMLVLSFFLILFSGYQIGNFTLAHTLMYFLLIVNAFFIALAFHIFVLSIGILTTEVDNTIMLYRDITQMGRLPIDIYHQPIQALITFIIPVGIMMTFPAKAFMGLLSLQLLFVALGIGFSLLGVSIMFWRYSLKHYASASS